MSYWTREYQAPLRPRAVVSAVRVGHEGQIGGEQGRFAYFDTQAHPGTVVEISDISGSKGSFFEHIRRGRRRLERRRSHPRGRGAVTMRNGICE